MPDSPLKNQIALVTGASSGIGRATAHRIAELGGNLILSARRKERLDQIAAEIHKVFGVETHVLPIDVRRASDVEESIAGLPESWRSIDILINNAGLARGLRPIFEARLDEIDDMVDTNIKGLVYVTRAVVPGMIERGRGHIVNIGSTAGHEVYPGGRCLCCYQARGRCPIQRDETGSSWHIGESQSGRSRNH